MRYGALHGHGACVRACVHAWGCLGDCYVRYLKLFCSSSCHSY